MKVAVVGSRSLRIDDISKYLPEDTEEIISGGASGVDTCAAHYADMNGIKLTECLPEYKRYGKGAPLKRNMQIVELSDEVIAFWDGSSKGTYFVINYCKKIGVKCTVYKLK